MEISQQLLNMSQQNFTLPFLWTQCTS